MNKFLYKIKFAGVLATLFLSASCGNEFLEVYPSDALVTETAITDLEGATTALYGAYDLLQSVNLYNCNYITYGEVRGEDMQSLNRNVRTVNYHTFSNKTPDNVDANLWYVPYRGLNRINNIIAAFDAGKVTDGSTDQRNAVLGQCYTLRGLLQFELVRMFGVPYQTNKNAPGIVIADRVITASEKPQRATVEQSYGQIVSDLTTALSYLTNAKAKNNGYVNYWAAKALLSRVYLYMADYDNALTHAKDVINNGGYTLVPNAEYVSSWELEFTSESIFDIINTDSDNGDRESIGYVALPQPGGYGAIIVTPVFVSLLQEDPADVRLGLLKNDTDGKLGYFAKYPGRGGKAFVNNVRVLRLSEVYLNAAEAALKKPAKDQTAADEYLDAIRKRANPATGFVSATVDLVLKERRKELVSEGHRFHDIMRLGVMIDRRTGNESRSFLINDDIPVVGVEQPYCVLPIPRAELNVNPDILQTPGYNQ